MKVALCVSGKWESIDFTNLLRERLPHDDFYTATYTGSDYNADFYMDEPELTYHPIIDTEPYSDQESKHRRTKTESNNKELYHQTNHWHKQILIHDYLMKNIPECDIVIRARFDTIVSNNINWNEYIQQSFDYQIPIGFNTIFYNATGRWLYHNKIQENPSDNTQFFINDALIIHPYDIWDCDLVELLYKQRKLRGAEEGWYQVLSEPSEKYHKSYHGGAYSAKKWKIVKDVDESLHN